MSLVPPRAAWEQLLPSGNDVYIANCKITMLSMGKITIIKGHFKHSYVKLQEGSFDVSKHAIGRSPGEDRDFLKS